MPRFTLHRPKGVLNPRDQDSTEAAQPSAPADEVPQGLRTDPRVKIIDELPRLLLIECPEQAAREWLTQMPGWMLQPEQRAKIPDPRPKLK
jgi:hypothetical protein